MSSPELTRISDAEKGEVREAPPPSPLKRLRLDVDVHAPRLPGEAADGRSHSRDSFLRARRRIADLAVDSPVASWATFGTSRKNPYEFDSLCAKEWVAVALWWKRDKDSISVPAIGQRFDVRGDSIRGWIARLADVGSTNAEHPPSPAVKT